MFAVVDCHASVVLVDYVPEMLVRVIDLGNAFEPTGGHHVSVVFHPLEGHVVELLFGDAGELLRKDLGKTRLGAPKVTIDIVVRLSGLLSLLGVVAGLGVAEIVVQESLVGVCVDRYVNETLISCTCLQPLVDLGCSTNIKGWHSNFSAVQCIQLSLCNIKL